MKEPPLEEVEYIPHSVKKEIKKQKDRALEENKHHEEMLFQQMMQDEENEWAIAQMCDEATYFDPQEYK